MTQHLHAVADHGRRQYLTATDPRDLIRQIIPRHHLGSRVVNKCTVLFKTMNDQTVETPRTLHGVRALRGILHPVSGISDVDPMGRSEDMRLALRRREQREMKDKKSNVANLLQAQWVRGKALPRGNWGTPSKKAPNDCDHPPNAVQNGGNTMMYSEMINFYAWTRSNVTTSWCSGRNPCHRSAHD